MKKVLTGMQHIILIAIAVLSLGVFGTTVFADEEVKNLMERLMAAPTIEAAEGFGVEMLIPRANSMTRSGSTRKATPYGSMTMVARKVKKGARLFRSIRTVTYPTWSVWVAFYRSPVMTSRQPALVSSPDIFTPLRRQE